MRLRPVFALWLWLAATLGGCGLTVQQRAAMEKFAGSTALLADLAGREVVEGRARVVALRMEARQLGLDAQIDPAEPALDFDGAMDAEQALRRLSAVDALRDFAALLGALADSRRADELHAASSALLGSLQNVEKVPLSPQKADALAALAASAGSAIAQARRAAVVRGVVEETREPVQALIGALRHDLALADLSTAAAGPVTLNWANMLAATHHGITNTLGKQLASRAAGSAFRERTLTDADLAAMWAQYAALEARTHQARADAAAMSAALAAAFDACEKAHAGLVAQVQSPELTEPDIDRFVAAVSSLVNHARVLRQRDARTPD